MLDPYFSLLLGNGDGNEFFWLTNRMVPNKIVVNNG
jgi:hypothetical protein